MKKIYSTPLVISTDVVRATAMGPVSFTKDVSTMLGVIEVP